MPDPGSGSPGSIVPPAAPDETLDADDASPGVVEQVKVFQHANNTGKYGTQKVDAYTKPDVKPGDEDPAKKKDAAWIEVLLIDKNKDPVPGEKYRITLPDNRVAEGTTGADGLVRIDGLDQPGNCKIEFPDLDGKAWSPA